MSVFGVDGEAGSGKTHRLMEVLADYITTNPLEEHQRVLALTFMHGARRRLHRRLEDHLAVRGKFECLTVDAFALRLRRRWRSLVGPLEPAELASLQFDRWCDIAGTLLERSDVREWVARSFPIVLIDEAQDLRPHRLRIVRALSSSTTLLIALDAFQCLDPSLCPRNPAAEWLATACDLVTLTHSRRTSVRGILDAAAAIRQGEAPHDGPGLRIVAIQGVYVAAAWLARAIASRNGGTVAVLTPSLTGSFARDVVTRVSTVPCGSAKLGPFPIRWEIGDDPEVAALSENLHLSDSSTIDEALGALGALPQAGAVLRTMTWLRKQRRVTDRVVVTKAELISRLATEIATRQHSAIRDSHGLCAMTIHQAKNREFDAVVVLWPYQVGGEGDAKRRLLYNAVTRAQRRCIVLVQNPQILKSAPFA